MNMADGLDLATARIRALQGIYAEAHGALENWGRWSLDLRGIFPNQKPSGTCKDYRSGDYDEPDLDLPLSRLDTPTRPEAAPRQPYDQKTAEILDERLHAAGGVPVEIRQVLKVAYVSRETPEHLMPKYAGCGIDAFCERLEHALRFTRRFV